MKHRIQFLRRRREFITLLGGAAAWPFAVRAQAPFLSAISADGFTARVRAFSLKPEGCGWQYM
jgi:hypothetical protein